MNDNRLELVDRVLAFWFGDGGTEYLDTDRPEWFTKDDGFDDEIRSNFLSDVEQAIAGDLEHLENDQMSCLALIILLDQFPRNLFRGSARAFAGDERALKLANHAIDMGYDKDIGTSARMFLYLPFEHSESLEDQDRCIALLEAAGDDAHAVWAVKHRDIIARFGRFPHRNEALGRKSTEEEVVFLTQPGSSF